MDSTLETTDNSLKITRTFKISPEAMWDLWTDPEKISEWHRPNKAEYTTEASGEAKVGSDYKIAMTHASGVHTVIGKFKELDKPNKLVYSWRWEGDPSGEISEVTISLAPVPEGTRLTLVHERLSGPESVRAHADGWLGCMENINDLVLERN